MVEWFEDYLGVEMVFEFGVEEVFDGGVRFCFG